MRKKRNSIIVLLLVGIVLSVISWKAYPYIIVGIDYLNGEELINIGNEKSLEEILKEHIESGKIHSDPKAMKALKNISTDLTKAKKSLSTTEQKEVVSLAQQGIDSTVNNDEDYLNKLTQFTEAYMNLSVEQQRDILTSIGKSINMRDYLTLKEKLK